MYSRDYLKKQIDEFGQVLAKIISDLLQLKGKGNTNSGIEISNQTLKTELDTDLLELIAIPPESLIETLKNKNVSVDNLERLAEILLLIADGDENEFAAVNRKSLYEKSLILFTHVQENGCVYSFDRHQKIERLKKSI